MLPSGKLTVSELENGPNRNRWFTELNSMVIFYSYVKLSEANAKWGPQTIAKLVYNSNVTMVYGIYNELVTEANLNQQTYLGGLTLWIPNNIPNAG